MGNYKDCKKKFGKNKTLEMPVSENAMIGLAIGSAIMGSKPIVNPESRVCFSRIRANI